MFSNPVQHSVKGEFDVSDLTVILSMILFCEYPAGYGSRVYQGLYLLFMHFLYKGAVEQQVIVYNT
jgi:hypothetical protein